MIMLHTLKKIKHIFLAVLPAKLFALEIDLVNQLLFTEEKNAVYKFTEGIVKEYDYCRKVMKKHFNKNLVISAEGEEMFQSSNKCWI